MFGVGIGHNAKRRIERQLFLQRLAESIPVVASTVVTSLWQQNLAAIVLSVSSVPSSFVPNKCFSRSK